MTTLYNLTCEGTNFISIKSPETLPDSNYSLVKIELNLDLLNVDGTYVGDTEFETCEFKTSLSLDLERLDLYIEELDSQYKVDSIDPETIIDLDMTNLDGLLKQLYFVEVGSYLCYCHFFRLDQESIGYPTEPLKISVPYESVSSELLDGNMFEYLGYYCEIMSNVPIESVGKSWLVQLDKFFSTWKNYYPSTLLIKNKEEAIFGAVLGYSNYLYSNLTELRNMFRQVHTTIEDGTNQIKQTSVRSVGLIDKDVQTRLKYCSTLITTLSTLVLKTLKKETDISIGEIKQLQDRLRVNLDGLRDEVQSHRKSLKTITYKYDKQLESKVQYLEKLIDRSEKHIEIYSRKTIEQLHEIKLQTIEEIKKQIPTLISEIVNKIK